MDDVYDRSKKGNGRTHDNFLQQGGGLPKESEKDRCGEQNLDRYPGVRIGDCSRPPDFEKLVQLAGDISATLQLARCSNKNFLLSNQGEENEPRLEGIFREVSDAVCGSRIFSSTRENSSTFRKATAGGILRSGNRFFYLTVAHAFHPTTDHAAAVSRETLIVNSNLILARTFIRMRKTGALRRQPAEEVLRPKFLSTRVRMALENQWTPSHLQYLTQTLHRRGKAVKKRRSWKLIH